MVAPWTGWVWSSISPSVLRHGIDASVVMSVASAPPTTDSDPHAPVTLPGAIALPILNCQPAIGVQLG